MLRSRYPGAYHGVYVPEDAQIFDYALPVCAHAPAAICPR